MAQLRDRSQTPRSLVVVIPTTNEEFHFDETRDSYDDVANQAIRKSTLRTDRKNPQTVAVVVHTQIINKGKIRRTDGATIAVMPFAREITGAEYEADMAELLEQLPEQFRGFVSQKAYEDGHSAGYSEVLIHADSLVHGLVPAIKAYKDALQEDFQQALGDMPDADEN